MCLAAPAEVAELILVSRRGAPRLLPLGQRTSNHIPRHHAHSRADHTGARHHLPCDHRRAVRDVDARYVRLGDQQVRRPPPDDCRVVIDDVVARGPFAPAERFARDGRVVDPYRSSPAVQGQVELGYRRERELDRRGRSLVIRA